MNRVYGHTVKFCFFCELSSFNFYFPCNPISQKLDQNLDQLLIYSACVSYSFSHLIKLPGPAQPTPFS